MTKRVLALCVVFVMLFSLTLDAFAKGSRSFGGRSSSFGGYSGSSKSSSFFGKSNSSSGYSSPSKSSGYTGSGSSSSGSKYSGGGTSGGYSSRSFSGSSPNVSPARKSYMDNYYKTQTSSSNYAKYKQNLTPDQSRVYNSSMSRTVTPSKKMNLESALSTRNSRIANLRSRPVIVNVNTGYFGGPFGYGSFGVGMWDMWFLTMASQMFWYHHWNDISPYRNYFDQQKFAEMEAKVKALEAQNIKKDPKYLDPDVDYDLQYSEDYQKKNASNLYDTNKSGGGFWSFMFKLLLFVAIIWLLIWIIRKIMRKRRQQAFESGIY